MKDIVPATGHSIRTLKNVPTSFRLAGLAVLNARRGRIRFDLPDGRSLQFDHGIEGPDAVVEVHDFDFAKRALSGGDVGFAEAYMDGQWSTPDLTAVLQFFSANFEAAGKLAVGGALIRSLNMIQHFFNRNSRTGARRNIEAHYDLGNEFYQLWLDQSMTYSSARFDNPNQTLEQGQAAKYEAICKGISAGPDSSILEIGCGWGGFAEHAVRTRGSRVTCLTISPAQLEYAQKRIFEAGLNERVDLRLEDYRDHSGLYDGVASIEMFEAVGESYWPSYFSTVHGTLKQGGRASLQIITIDDDLFPRYRKRADFIQRYIFPGGMLPSELALKDQFARAGLRYDGANYFGQDYARTCSIWKKSFNERWPEIEALGFGTPFRRMWNFYLSYCEAGFTDGRINVGQFDLTRT